MKKWTDTDPDNITVVFQITSETFKYPKQSAVVCVKDILYPHSARFAFTSAFISKWHMNNVYLSDHQWPLATIQVLSLVERRDVCPSCYHHMMSDLMVSLWITAPSLTDLLNARNRCIKVVIILLRGRLNGIQIQSGWTIHALALWFEENHFKKVLCSSNYWSFVQILISAALVSLHTFCICV